MVKKTVKTTNDPSVAWAEKLWTRLHNGLFDTQNALIAIIDARAWEPLGYETFAKAWIDRMSDLTIVSELRPHVVYQLFSEGLTPQEVAAAVKGIGLDTAKDLARQRDHGVPAEKTARQRKPSPPLPYVTVFMKVPRADLAEWRRIAKRNKTSVDAVALSATSAAFEELR